MRQAMWSTYLAHLERAQLAHPGRMPWETVDQVITLSRAAAERMAIAVLKACPEPGIARQAADIMSKIGTTLRTAAADAAMTSHYTHIEAQQHLAAAEAVAKLVEGAAS